MAQVVVFHYTDQGKLPKLSEEDLNKIKRKFYDKLENYPNVWLNGAFVDEEGRGICEWEGPNAEVVEEIVKKVIGEQPADGAVVVKRVVYGGGFPKASGNSAVLRALPFGSLNGRVCSSQRSSELPYRATSHTRQTLY